MAEENAEQKEKVEQKENAEQKASDNTIFVGKKGAMAYVLGVMTQFSTGNHEVNIKARGNSISRAVDVAEIVKRRFGEDSIKIKNIDIGTEELESTDRGKINVSTIAITLAK